MRDEIKTSQIIYAIREKRIRITDHAVEEAIEDNMKPFNKCPICGGELIEKEVEKLLKGGSNSAVITVKTEVCWRCWERLYSKASM